MGTRTAGRADAARGAIRFSRNEWSGAFGDLGTDLPLLVGMILAAHLDAASVLTLFGVMQILTALRYQIPMPVQPLKAMAALVIAQGLPGNVLYGAGLAIGISMLVALVIKGLDRLFNGVRGFGPLDHAVEPSNTVEQAAPPAPAPGRKAA